MADSTPARNPTIVVAGDVMIDWNLTVDRDVAVATRTWREAGRVNRLKQYGGAWLLADLVQRFAARTAYKDGVRCIAHPADGDENNFHQTYSVLAPGSDDVWRVQEFLGVQSAENVVPRMVQDDDPYADIVVLLDSDLGFDPSGETEAKSRLEPAAAWPAALRTPGHHPWIILKSSVPAFDGPMWQHLIGGNYAKKLVLVMTVDDLRRKEIQLLRRLSWERAAQDVAAEMRENPALRALHQCLHVVVSFGTAGAMLFSRDEKPRLVFDPASMEGEWEPANKGSMIGYTTILAAAIAHEVMIHPKDPNPPQIIDALPRGIAGMRALFEKGFGTKKKPQVFTSHLVAAALRRKKAVSTAIVTDEMSESWTILEERLKESAKISPENKVDDVLYELAARVAIYGPEVALADVPQLRIRKLFAVDREEIESLRSIKGLLSEYVSRKPSKPFSIAVFGSPGSGKSFGVEEIASHVGGDRIRLLTFNLSQFAHSDDLHGAFHQVRDVSLRGQIPVVFWDEFDTTYHDKPLGWLRYFIGPMQDGLFQDGQITHPIGTSIFVFAGGTASSKDEFVNPPSEAGDARKALKVPDFISRLKGFLNVTGPNRRDAPGDPHYLIRRAILLRSMIDKHCPDLFRKEGKARVLQIDPGVLHAFLTTGTYRHGARSLESVIAMSALARRKHFESSSLPPEHQLGLHVEMPFESLAQDVKFTHNVVLLEQLAEMAHDVFRAAKKKTGWRYALVRDDDRKHHDLLVPYAKLPERDKESNRATIRWIPQKIATEGYVMAPAGSGRPAQMNPDEVERLAKLEHEIWMKRKRAAGYEWGEKATESPKRSPYLVEWKKLSPENQLVDRSMVEAIPAILRKAGYILVRRHPDFTSSP